MKKACSVFLLFILLVSNLIAQKDTNFKKEISPLLAQNKFDDALPLLIKFYTERIDANGLWTNKAILQMENMEAASEGIANIYYKKAKEQMSAIYADSALYWFQIMINDDHPNKSHINSHILDMQEIKEQAKRLQEQEERNQKIKIEEENEKKRIAEQEEKLRLEKEEKNAVMMSIIDDIIYCKLLESCIEFERVYYRTRMYNPSKAKQMFISLETDLKKQGLNNLPVDTAIKDIPLLPDEHGSKSSDAILNTKYNSLQFHDVSFEIEGNIVYSLHFSASNDPNFYSYDELVPLSDSNMVIYNYSKLIMQKTREFRKELDIILDEVEKLAREEYTREQQDKHLAENAPNENLMLSDKTLPNASTKLCDYRDGRFVAYVENNTVYRRYFSESENKFTEWEVKGLKILNRNGKKIFYYDHKYCEVTIDSNGLVKLYKVSESTGERLTDEYREVGYVNGNRFQVNATNPNGARDGYLFKGNKVEAVIIVLVCNGFK